MKIWMFALILFTNDALACVSLYTREIQSSIVAKQDGGYVVEVVSQEFETKSRTPVSGQLKYQFLEDDFALLFQIVHSELNKKGSDEAALKEPLLMTMQGYYDFVQKNHKTIIKKGQQDDPGFGKKFDKTLGRLADILKKTKAGSTRQGADDFARAMSELGLRHSYARLDGRDPVQPNDLFPPKTRGMGCSAATDLKVGGLEQLSNRAIPASADESQRDSLVGFTSGVK